jgi:WD40 repeat protein
MCQTKNKPNDIFENSNTIITVEKDVIEVFEFSQNMDNNDKITNNLVKKSEINLDNNNNNNNNFNINNINNDNNNSDNEILCIEYSQLGFFACGHASGLMSLWKPDSQVYLQRTQAQKLHDGAINKILYTKLSDNKNYLISCSSDKTVKVYCLEDNNVVKTQSFDHEVMDVKLVNDFNKNRVFIISLKNGKLFAMNEGFNPLFEIPSRFKTNITRHVIPLTNPKQSETRGDLLAITELSKIDVFAWIKEGSINLNPHTNNNTSFNGPHNNPHNGPHNAPHYGPYIGAHNSSFNNNHPHFPYFSNPMFGPRGRV